MCSTCARVIMQQRWNIGYSIVKSAGVALLALDGLMGMAHHSGATRSLVYENTRGMAGSCPQLPATT